MPSTKLIPAILILFLTTLAFGQKKEITCRIKAEKAVDTVRSTPKITIQIKNNTDSIIYLVEALDGSDDQLRRPYSYFTIEKLGDPSYSTEALSRCGNVAGIDISNFVAVKPGETFNPYIPQTTVMWDSRLGAEENFKEKGKYKITYHYFAKEDDLKEWMGRDMAFEMTGNTGEVLPEKKNDYEVLQEYFMKVPKVNLVSNSIIIEIK